MTKVRNCVLDALSINVNNIISLVVGTFPQANPQLNELDNTISEMLKEGAQVDLTANQLTLATAKQTLTYKLADLMN